MARYRKIPVVIDAEQFLPEELPWPKGVVEAPTDTGYGIRTLESGANGYHVVTPGDWIITGVKGEKYACKPDVFAATYEVEE